MDSVAFANQPPICPLFSTTILKARKPAQGDRNGAAIAQIDGESIIADMNVLSERIFDFNGQSIHSMPP